MGAEGPQGPLKASSQSLTAKRYRSLAEPSRAESAPIPRDSEYRREAPKSYERGGNPSSEPLRSFPNSLTRSSSGNSRSLPSAGVTGGAGLSGKGGRPRKPLRKNPRFTERRWLASDSGESRRLPINGGPSDSGKSRRSPIGSGPSGSGAARRRPSARSAGQLEAAAAPCLMLRYSSEENPPASPLSRRRERLRCPRRGRPRPPAAGGS